MVRTQLKRWSITLAAISVGVAHAAFPDVTIDFTTALLLAIAVAPWLGDVFKSLEAAGIKVEYHDLARAESELAKAQLVTPKAESAIPDEPREALLYLINELDRRVTRPAARDDTTIIEDLLRRGALAPGQATALDNLRVVLDRARTAHTVDLRATEWVRRVGPSLLREIDHRLDSTE